MYASTITLDGLIELDTNNIAKALDSFLLAFNIEKPFLDPDDPFTASSLNALSIAYTKLGDFDRAVETGQNAIDIRLRTKSDRIDSCIAIWQVHLFLWASQMKPRKCSRDVPL